MDVTYTIGETVKIQVPNCPCRGGGMLQYTGPVVGVLHNGAWVQVDTPQGVVVVKKENILSKV